MIKPYQITFTGIDSATDLDEVERLSGQYPIEWGILFSQSRQGKDPRYPPLHVVERAVMKTRASFAAHLCGGYTRAIMDGTKFNHDEIFLEWFDRIQINHRAPEIEKILDFSESSKHHYVNSDDGVAEGFYTCVVPFRTDEFPPDTAVDWLFDASGGTGKLPKAWPKYPTNQIQVGNGYGYAGGIRPDNVLEVLEAIDARGPYWIDMETGVRTDDWLDLSKCREVCEKVYG